MNLMSDKRDETSFFGICLKDLPHVRKVTKFCQQMESTVVIQLNAILYVDFLFSMPCVWNEKQAIVANVKITMEALDFCYSISRIRIWQIQFSLPRSTFNFKETLFKLIGLLHVLRSDLWLYF